MNSGGAPLRLSLPLVGIAIGLWMIAQVNPATEEIIVGYPNLGWAATLLGWGVDPVAWSANLWFAGGLLAWWAGKNVLSGFLALLALVCSAYWIYAVEAGMTTFSYVGAGTWLWCAAFLVMAVADGVRLVEGFGPPSRYSGV